MKPWSILFVIGAILILAGCADPLEKQSGQEVQERLQRGITGQGQIGPEQRDAGDPANEHGVPQTYP